ncbi:MAG: metal-dependent hydrolase [Ramlibacter sp.]|jgi:membrane-bound metal-dependent hydrolase YbcI (DUF457 family)
MDVITHALSGAVIGAACAPTEREQLPLMLVGAVAGLAPDLDALSALRGPTAAWRQHRVWLHGLPTLPAQGLVIYLTTQGLTGIPLDPQMLWLTIIGGLLVHLLLDTVTSFGTVLGFPFSSRRWSSRSHFITDPFILMILLASLALNIPAIGIVLCAAWLMVGFAVRLYVVSTLNRSWSDPKLAVRAIHVEPGPYAPFRWLVIVHLASGDYLLAQVSGRGKILSPWHRESSCCAPGLIRRAYEIPLVQAFLATADCPCWKVLTSNAGSAEVLLEDLKWRVAAPFRPLAFQIHLEDDPAADRAVQLPLAWLGPVRNPAVCVNDAIVPRDGPSAQ